MGPMIPKEIKDTPQQNDKDVVFWNVADYITKTGAYLNI